MADNRLLRQDIPSSLGDALYQTGRNALLYPFRNPEAMAEFGLGMAPVSGEAMSARDAWNASGEAGNALMGGNYRDAAAQYGNMATGILGALPGAGIIARGTKRGAAWMDRNLPGGVNRLLDGMMPANPRSTTFSGAGPTADDYRYVRRTQGDNPDTGVGYMMFLDHKGDLPNAADSLRSYGKNTWLGKPVDAVNAEDIAPDVLAAMQRRGLLSEYHFPDVDSLSQALNPKSIVNSADFWDNPELVEMAWEDVIEPLGKRSVLTPDGMILFDPSGVKPYR